MARWPRGNRIDALSSPCAYHGAAWELLLDGEVSPVIFDRPKRAVKGKSIHLVGIAGTQWDVSFQSGGGRKGGAGVGGGWGVRNRGTKVRLNWLAGL